MARLVVKYLLSDGEPIVVACDGTFFKRWGRKVFQARWAYDGSAQGGRKIAFGNTWAVAAIVILSFRVIRSCDLRRLVEDSVVNETPAA